MTEHFPNPDSRVVLDREHRDALGMPRVRLDWTYGAADWDGFERAAAGLGDALGAAGQGRLCWPVRREQLLAIASASRHHMGTTRMDADPRGAWSIPTSRSTAWTISMWPAARCFPPRALPTRP